MRTGQIVQLALLTVGIALTAIAIVVITRTILVRPPAPDFYCDGDDTELAAKRQHHHRIKANELMFKRFQKALTYRTITTKPKVYDREQLAAFIDFIQKNFTLIHSSPQVHLEIINDLSLFYTIKGSNPALKPFMLLAHLDVVPVQEEHWTRPPFGGVIENDEIYGRGALDLKSVLFGILEALEFALSEKTVFERGFYLAFGHDEEGRGLDGAAVIARIMKERGLADLEFILDEGPYIFRDSLPGIKGDVAMVGVAEKGLAYIKLTAHGQVGHSSIPPPETAIVHLSKAVAKLNAYSHPNRFGDGPEKDMVEALAPYSSLPYRILFSNLWLFQPVVARLLENNRIMNSFIRTTSAVTMFKAGIKDNILPGSAEAVVNHRIYPLSSVAEVLAHDRTVVNDPDIDVDVLGVAIEPHPIAPYGDNAFGYQTIRTSIQQVYPKIAIIPGMMYAATDTRWYLNFTDSIYRFSPAFLTLNSMNIVHGHDERIGKDTYVKLINFYHHILLNSQTSGSGQKRDKDEF